MGVLIPRGAYEALGVSDETYHVFAIVGGGLAGIMVVLGLILLLIRKIVNNRVRTHATFAHTHGSRSLSILMKCHPKGKPTFL